MPDLIEGTAHTKTGRGRKLPAEPGPSEEYLNGSPRTLLTLRQACHTTKVRDILAYALEHCRPTLSVTFPSSETRVYETARVTKDTTLDGIVIECATATPFRDDIHIFWGHCDARCRRESRLEETQLKLRELAEKKGVRTVAELVIETTTVVKIMRETLSACWGDGRGGGGEGEQLAAGGGAVDMASVLEAAQTELKAHKEKFRKEPLWSRYGEEFELWVDAIGTWIRHLMITLDSAAAKGFFEASDVLLRQTAATWMRYAKALKMAPARDARRRKLLEDSLNYWMVELNESKVDQHLKELLAICAQTSGVPGSIFKNTGKFRVGVRAAPRITLATGGKTIVQAPGAIIPKSTCRCLRWTCP